MSKNMIRTLCAALALILVCCAAALAATETQTYKTYTPLDAQQHTVIEETWIYPVVNGHAGSGRPAASNGSGQPGDSNTYTEPHTFVNGVCTLCGYQAETFTNAMGVVLAKGTPAADVLKQVFEALPEGSQMGIMGVTQNDGDNLVGLVNNGAAPDMFMPALSAFPADNVDNTPCNVVTLAYSDDEGNPVTENYAFDTADTTLVKLY